MRVARLTFAIIACLSVLWPYSLLASEPSYGTFTLDFVKPLQLGQPNEIEARFVFYANCVHGDMRITIPALGNDSAFSVSVWNGPIEAWRAITASVPISELSLGAYNFRAECSAVECDNPMSRKGVAGRSIWVTSEGIISVPIGFDPDGLAYILNEIEAADLPVLTIEELRSKAPQLYKVLTFDSSIPSARSMTRDADTFTLAPRTPRPPAARPVKRMGTIQGVPGEPDSAWKALSQTERDSVALFEWRRRSDSVHRFGTPVPIDFGTNPASSDSRGPKQLGSPKRTAPDTLAIRKWQEEARARRDSLMKSEGENPKSKKR